MHIFGDRQFVEIPGEERFELPPLLVSRGVRCRLEKVAAMAAQAAEADDLVPKFPLDSLDAQSMVEQRKLEIAVNLMEAYLAIRRHWVWGDGIIGWIKQCETTFETRPLLRPLLRPDLWPHAGRSSFVRLLADKAVSADGVVIEHAVGLRLSFRQPPPLRCFSDQFLFYLNKTVAETAYQQWSAMNPAPVSDLPPERFALQVVEF